MSIEVPLSKGQVTIIDDEDAKLVIGYRWQINNGYASRGRLASDGPGPAKIYMHNVILEVSPVRKCLPTTSAGTVSITEDPI